jgi:tetratricopeptide (TPR) repeat protein
MNTYRSLRLPGLALALGLACSLTPGVVGAAASAPTFDADLLAIQTNWARANYQLNGDTKEAAFDELAEQAAAFTGRNPGRAEPLIWEGIVLSTAAGVKGGLGALGLAKQSRAHLDAALAIDPQALQGSAYTSLGTLYHKVPGFPIGFGSDKKAREYLEKALAINPAGIDPNYFYGEFLLDEGEDAAARRHLEKALQAPPRLNRETADEGRRREVRALLATISKP